MNWDDLRHVLALAKAGSLARAARELDVDHTTVGRRIDALEADLGLRLFTRTKSGYVLTQEALALLPDLQQVEAAVLAFERCAHAHGKGLEGTVRITSAETFAARWLAPRLASFGKQNPGLSIELATGPNIFDLGRREADVAVRTFRSKHEDLVVVRAAEMAFSLYATEGYLARCRTPTSLDDLRAHELLSVDPKPQAVEAVWIHRVARGARFVFSSNLTMAVLNAALTGAGIAVLPCYIGDAEPTLRRLPMPDEPSQPIWLVVHRDLQHTRRVRVVLDFLTSALRADAALLAGKR
jgi:DNA-binding transcriptional LysR family regulator